MERMAAVSERSRFIVRLRLTGIPEVAQRQWPVLLKGVPAFYLCQTCEHRHHLVCHPQFHSTVLSTKPSDLYEPQSAAWFDSKTFLKQIPDFHEQFFLAAWPGR